MASLEVLSLYVISSGLPGLNTADQPTDIKPDETPDGYGFDLSVDNAIKKGTIPSGTARIAKTAVILEGAANITYYWYYNRLWNITNRTASTASNILTVGAPNYEDIYVPQRLGKIYFDEDTQTIQTIIPFSEDKLLVAKNTTSYVLSNLGDTRLLTPRTDCVQELACPGSTYACELDGLVYVSNTAGLFSYDGNVTKECLRKVRDNLTGFTSLALVADYSKKRIIGGSAFVYDVATDKLFKYSTTAFRFTTREFHLPNYAPFSSKRVWFIVKRTGTDDAWLTYQVKFEDEDWQDTVTTNFKYESEKYTAIPEDLAQARSARRMQMRITDMSSNLTLKAIHLDSEGFNADDYST